ncbi:MAG: nucleotidyltransferase family protein [Chloroflexi bacterium]|nr:nucleotidyltransferase family protein [Chloroflexota bacterium]
MSLDPDSLAEIAPLLLRGGTGGLVWWRMRRSELGASRIGLDFKQAYRLHTLQAVLHERQLKEAVALLRSAEVDPLLAKGWAVARLYPERGLRPYGDIDLCVRPQDYSKSVRLFLSAGVPGCPVDLHPGFDDLDDRKLADLYDRSQLPQLEDLHVRILGPEDHLRLLCVHLLRHGLRRPLWLCDIAAMVESLPASFDWDYCLRGPQWRRQGVVYALMAARRLLGARLSDEHVAARAADPPRWFIPTILRQWGRPYEYFMPVLSYLRHRGGLAKLLRSPWPDPIQATAVLRCPFNEFPRLPFQVAAYVVRVESFIVRRARFLLRAANQKIPVEA